MGIFDLARQVGRLQGQKQRRDTAIENALSIGRGADAARAARRPDEREDKRSQQKSVLDILKQKREDARREEDIEERIRDNDRQERHFKESRAQTERHFQETQRRLREKPPKEADPFKEEKTRRLAEAKARGDNEEVERILGIRGPRVEKTSEESRREKGISQAIQGEEDALGTDEQMVESLQLHGRRYSPPDYRGKELREDREERSVKAAESSAELAKRSAAAAEREQIRFKQGQEDREEQEREEVHGRQVKTQEDIEALERRQREARGRASEEYNAPKKLAKSLMRNESSMKSVVSKDFPRLNRD